METKKKRVRRNTRIKPPGVKDPVVDIETAREKFLELWSDPLDLRTEEEIAVELHVHPMQLKKWRSDPAFYEPATERFQKAFRGSVIPILKNLFRQVEKHKSLGATKVLLQLLGMLEGQGTKINIMQVGTGGSGSSPAVDFTDEELDLEIHRLITEAMPEDVVYVEGKVIPLEVEVLGVKDDTGKTAQGIGTTSSIEPVSAS